MALRVIFFASAGVTENNATLKDRQMRSANIFEIPFNFESTLIIISL